MKYTYYRIIIQKLLKGLFIFHIIVFSGYLLAASNNSECIEKYKSKLLKGGWDYGFYCKYGSSFIKINTGDSDYIVYNYIYRFLTYEGGAIHGGQRLVFFSIDYNYIGQFYFPSPEIAEASSIKILLTKDKNILILSDGQKSVGKIILSHPPKGVLYWEDLDFFK
jgi:hypothetical protein